MIASKRCFIVACIALASLVARCCAQRCISVPPSSRHYGQDGPWGAVTVNYGGYPNRGTPDAVQWTPIDLFPGGEWSSVLISPQSCLKNSTGLCGIGGTADPTGVAQTVDNRSIGVTGGIGKNNGANSGLNMGGEFYTQTMNIGASGTNDGGSTVYNTSTVIVKEMNLTTPSGKTFTDIEVGFLALGAGAPYNTFGYDSYQGQTPDPIVAWNLPGYFYDQDQIPSFSYTLHVGSAALDYPPSLTFGGYDQGRIVGPATMFRVSTPDESDQRIPAVVKLLDIGIGVHNGGSPFNFTSKDGLLIKSDNTKRDIPVSPDPIDPYLSMPKETCDAIAAELPVNYDQSGYYLWDTEDSSYSKIVSSPAYLSFTFPSSAAYGTPDKVVIKVPFKLLNLTLGPSLSGLTKPVPYFPCMPYRPESQDDHYFLGRAFLQAALFGRNWSKQLAWLAQAPGPGSSREGLGYAPKDLATDDWPVALSGDAYQQFNSTWSDYWVPLSEDTPTDSSVPHPDEDTKENTKEDTNGLSVGVKAGIGAGAGAFCLALIVIAALVWRRRTRKTSTASQAELMPHSFMNDSKKDSSPSYSAFDPNHNVSGLDPRHFPYEAQLQWYPSDSEALGMSELSGTQVVHEIGSGRR
jgi:hypothetical protein